MLAYATEKTKGRYIALFWSIFNIGACSSCLFANSEQNVAHMNFCWLIVGSIIPMATNWNLPAAKAASGSTYIAFLVLNLVGLVIALFLSNPQNVILPNGRAAQSPRQPTWLSEFKGLIFALRTEPIVLLLFPFFLSSNWFYAYQFNAINGSGYFDIRGRSLNNLLYW